jgi:stage II sporulation protein D
VAAFTEGDRIGTQPLRTLASRRLLGATMRHEFLHALVEQQAGPAAPLWLREGLVEVWAEHDRKAAAQPSIRINALDAMLAHASTESDSAAAHRTAAIYASRLLTRYGRERAVEWLRSGVPANVVATLGQR